DQATCDAAEICVSDCSSGTCVCTSCNNSTCDAAIKERIRVASSGTTYGLTVDFKQRVWFGGTRIIRYDPSQPAASRLTMVSTLASGGTMPFIHGIAADAEGWIWGADVGNGIVRLEGDNP